MDILLFYFTSLNVALLAINSKCNWIVMSLKSTKVGQKLRRRLTCLTDYTKVKTK